MNDGSWREGVVGKVVMVRCEHSERYVINDWGIVNQLGGSTALEFLNRAMQ